jgi:hypothetical protein
VSVAALLRREGRGPHVADRPLVPRGHSRFAPPPPDPPRLSARKAAVAAGALFAATAVLGPSVVQDSGAPSITGRGTALPLPPTDTPLSTDYDWFSDAASAGREEMVFAAMRQVFAEGIPSEVGSTTYDRLVTEPSAGGQSSAVRRVQTPDRASTGSTDPSVAPESGTVPPGGAGTPPGGIWSPAPPPEGGRPPPEAPAGARSHGNGHANGHSTDKPGNGPPSSTPAAAKSEDGRRNGPPEDTPGNGPPSSTPAGTKAAGGGNGRAADRSAAAAGENRGDPQRKGAQRPDPPTEKEHEPARKTKDAGSERSDRDNGSSREKNSRSRAASADSESDDSGKKGDRASRERSAAKSDERDDSSGGSDSRKSTKGDSDDGKGSGKGSDKGSGKGGGKGGRSADD